MMLHNLFSRKKQLKKVAVLMYHRVATPAFDPWDLVVHADHFEAQLSLLHKKYSVISMPQLLDFMQGGDIPDQSVCLSFDDAYLDNFDTALPILERLKLPACFFVPGFFIEQQLPFWWDELAGIIFSQALQSPENKATWNNWRWPAPPPDQYCQQLISCWEKLRPLPYAAIRNELDQLSANTVYDVSASKELLPMTVSQLEKAGETGLITLGVHTQTHPFLPHHEKMEQEKEIRENAAWLRLFPGAMPNVIAYPYGAYNADTLAVATQQGLVLGFTTKAQTVQQGMPTLELGRFQVKNWPVREFEHQLANWFNNY